MVDDLESLLMKKRCYWLTFLLLIACSGCDDDSSTPENNNPQQERTPTLPTKPTLSQTSITPDSVTLSWSTSSEAEYYQLYKDDEAQTQISDLNIKMISVATLKSDTQYGFTIDACNSNGCNKSDTFTITTPSWPSLNVQVQSKTENAISLTWNKMSNMKYSVSETSTTTETTMAENMSTTSYTATNLAIDTPYRFTIKACNPNECIAAAISTSTLSVIPSPPQTVNVITNHSNSVSLTWTPSTYANFYQVSRDGNLITTNDLTLNSFTDNTVNGDTRYQYEVVACNQLGCSTASTLDVTTPKQSISMHTEAISVSTISLAWNAIDKATHYKLEQVDNSNNTSIIAYVNALKYTITELAANTRYTFKISACFTNNCVQTTQLNVKTATFASILPDPVSNLRANITARSVQLSWDPSAHTDYYKVYQDSVLLANSKVTQSSFVNNSLSANTSYNYDVEACNPDGCSTKTTISITTLATPTPSSIPAQPLPPTLNIAGTTKVRVSWQIINDATTYKLFRNGTEIPQAFTQNNTDDSHLSVNTTYQYSLQACNNLGCSARSADSSITTASKDTLTITLSGFDVGPGESVGLNVYTEDPINSILLENRFARAQNGSLVYNSKIISNGRYGVNVRGSATTGQTCTSNKPGFSRRTGGQDVEVLINCETPVSFSFAFATVERVFKANTSLVSQPVIAEKADGTKINVRAVLFTSSNEKVATIDENTGIITQHSAGITQIRARSKLGFYIATPISYELHLMPSTSAVELQKVEFGQSVLLQVQNQFQQLASKAKTIIRAFFYAKSATDTNHPNVNVEILSANGKYQQAMICPTNAKVGEFTAEAYNNNDVCYTVIPSAEAEKHIHQNIKVTIKTEHGQHQSEFPKVSKNSSLKIVMVPIEVNGQSHPMQSEQAIKDAIQRVFPFHQISLSIREKYAYQGSYTGFPVATNNWGPFLTEIENLRRAESDNATHYYGMMPSRCHGVLGLAFVAGLSGIGVSSNCGDASLYQTFIHELGHNLSLGHASCGTTAGDPFWLTDNGWVGASQGQLSPQPLFNIHNETVFAPGEHGINNTDVMGYCNGRWLSEYNVNKVINYISGKSIYTTPTSSPLINSQSTAHKDNALIISGTIINNQKVIMNPIVLSTNNHYSQHQGDYRMVIISQSGAQIEYAFTPLKFDHHDNNLYISEVIPVVSNINKIMFYHHQQLLDFQLSSVAPATNAASMTTANQQVFNNSIPITIDKTASETIIRWNNNQYPWMTLTFIANNNKKRVVMLNKTGGNIKTDYFNDKATGEIIVTISDGFNNLLLRQAF